MVERIGLANFLEGIEIDIDPNMVSDPRNISYVTMKDWPAHEDKWRQIQEKNAATRAKDLAIMNAA